jgi:hypothetical protein
MALLYPWATKEYLLWNMSLGQIILYHNQGLEQKYGKPDGERPKTYADYKRAREEMRRAGLLEEVKKSDEVKASYRDKYGEVE